MSPWSAGVGQGGSALASNFYGLTQVDSVLSADGRRPVRLTSSYHRAHRQARVERLEPGAWSLEPGAWSLEPSVPYSVSYPLCRVLAGRVARRLDRRPPASGEATPPAHRLRLH